MLYINYKCYMDSGIKTLNFVTKIYLSISVCYYKYLELVFK